MGLLDFLFGNKMRTNCEILPDKIWLTTEAKFAGIAQDVAERARSGTVAILLVAHFPDVLARLDEIAESSTAVPTKAVLARSLSPDFAANLPWDASSTIELVVGERHPLLSVDRQMEEYAGAFPCRCRVSYHQSLDDPVIEIFTGEWVKQLLTKLMMAEDEAIESASVVRRIHGAQRKIEAVARGNEDADSAAEWLARNCPGMKNG